MLETSFVLEMIPYLPFYDAGELPSEMADMMLGDIIKLSVERNRLLRTLDVIDLQEENKTNYSQVERLLLDTKIYGQKSEEERQKNLLSHYFVPLPYLKTKVMRDWFVRLFRARLRWKLLGFDKRYFYMALRYNRAACSKGNLRNTYAVGHLPLR